MVNRRIASFDDDSLMGHGVSHLTINQGLMWKLELKMLRNRIFFQQKTTSFPGLETEKWSAVETA